MGRSCRSVAIALLAQAAVIASFVVLIVNLVQLGYLSERYRDTVSTIQGANDRLVSSRYVAPLPADEPWSSGSSGSGSFGSGALSSGDGDATTAAAATAVMPRVPSTPNTQDVPFNAPNGSAAAELEVDTFGPQGAEATGRTHPAFNLSNLSTGGAAVALPSSNSSGGATHASSNSSAGVPHEHSNSSGGAGAFPSSSIAPGGAGASPSSSNAPGSAGTSPSSPATSTLSTTTALAPAVGSASFKCGADDGSGSKSSGSGSSGLGPSGKGESDADGRVAFDPFCCAGCSEGVYDVGCAGCAERSNFEVLMGTYKPETRQCCPFDLDPLAEELTVMYALAIYAVIAVIITELGKLKVLLWPDTRDEEDKKRAPVGRYTWRPVSKSRLGRLGRWIRLKLAGVDEFDETTVDPKGGKDTGNGWCCNCTWACPKLKCSQKLKEKKDSCQGCSSCVSCSHCEPRLISSEDAKYTLKNTCSNVMFHCCGAGGQSTSYNAPYETDPCCPCLLTDIDYKCCWMVSKSDEDKHCTNIPMVDLCCPCLRLSAPESSWWCIDTNSHRHPNNVYVISKPALFFGLLAHGKWISALKLFVSTVIPCVGCCLGDTCHCVQDDQVCWSKACTSGACSCLGVCQSKVSSCLGACKSGASKCWGCLVSCVTSPEPDKWEFTPSLPPLWLFLLPVVSALPSIVAAIAAIYAAAVGGAALDCYSCGQRALFTESHEAVLSLTDELIYFSVVLAIMSAASALSATLALATEDKKETLFHAVKDKTEHAALEIKKAAMAAGTAVAAASYTAMSKVKAAFTPEPPEPPPKPEPPQMPAITHEGAHVTLGATPSDVSVHYSWEGSPMPGSEGTEELRTSDSPTTLGIDCSIAGTKTLHLRAVCTRQDVASDPATYRQNFVVAPTPLPTLEEAAAKPEDGESGKVVVVVGEVEPGTTVRYEWGSNREVTESSTQCHAGERLLMPEGAGQHAKLFMKTWKPGCAPTPKGEQEHTIDTESAAPACTVPHVTDERSLEQNGQVRVRVAVSGWDNADTLKCRWSGDSEWQELLHADKTPTVASASVEKTFAGFDADQFGDDGFDADQFVDNNSFDVDEFITDGFDADQRVDNSFDADQFLGDGFDADQRVGDGEVCLNVSEPGEYSLEIEVSNSSKRSSKMTHTIRVEQVAPVEFERQVIGGTTFVVVGEVASDVTVRHEWGGADVTDHSPAVSTNDQIKVPEDAGSFEAGSRLAVRATKPGFLPWLHQDAFDVFVPLCATPQVSDELELDETGQSRICVAVSGWNNDDTLKYRWGDSEWQELVHAAPTLAGAGAEDLTGFGRDQSVIDGEIHLNVSEPGECSLEIEVSNSSKRSPDTLTHTIRVEQVAPVKFERQIVAGAAFVVVGEVASDVTVRHEWGGADVTDQSPVCSTNDQIEVPEGAGSSEAGSRLAVRATKPGLLPWLYQDAFNGDVPFCKEPAVERDPEQARITVSGWDVDDTVEYKCSPQGQQSDVTSYVALGAGLSTLGDHESETGNFAYVDLDMSEAGTHVLELKIMHTSKKTLIKQYPFVVEQCEEPTVEREGARVSVSAVDDAVNVEYTWTDPKSHTTAPLQLELGPDGDGSSGRPEFRGDVALDTSEAGTYVLELKIMHTAKKTLVKQYPFVVEQCEGPTVEREGARVSVSAVDDAVNVEYTWTDPSSHTSAPIELKLDPASDGGSGHPVFCGNVELDTAQAGTHVLELKVTHTAKATLIKQHPFVVEQCTEPTVQREGARVKVLDCGDDDAVVYRWSSDMDWNEVSLSADSVGGTGKNGHIALDTSKPGEHSLEIKASDLSDSKQPFVKTEIFTVAATPAPEVTKVDSGRHGKIKFKVDLGAAASATLTPPPSAGLLHFIHAIDLEEKGANDDTPPTEMTISDARNAAASFSSIEAGKIPLWQKWPQVALQAADVAAGTEWSATLELGGKGGHLPKHDWKTLKEHKPKEKGKDYVLRVWCVASVEGMAASCLSQPEEATLNLQSSSIWIEGQKTMELKEDWLKNDGRTMELNGAGSSATAESAL